MLASANQVQYYDGNWFMGVLNTWESKGILNRLIVFSLYKISTSIVPFCFGYVFEIINKFSYGIFILGFFIVCLKISDVKNVFMGTLILSLAFLSAFSETHLQAESHVCLIFILAFSIYLNAVKIQKYKNFKLVLIGFLLGSIFFIKSVLILMSLAFGAIVLLYNRSQGIKISPKEILMIFMGGFCALFAGFIVILKLAPFEIQNMLNASKYQQTLFDGNLVSVKKIIKQFYYQFSICCFKIPVIFVGFCAFLHNLICNLKQKDFKSAFLRFFSFLVPVFIIIAANRYFAYHFLIFIPFLIYEIIEQMRAFKNFEFELYYLDIILILSTVFILVKVDIPINLILIFFALYILICVPVNFSKFEKLKQAISFKIPFLISSIIFLSYISVFTNNFHSSIRMVKKMYEHNIEAVKKLNLKRNEKVLYLDFGYGAYFLQNPPYLKEYNCLCIQRIQDVDAIKKVLNYKGRYIVVFNEWFDMKNKNEQIHKKMQKEYHKKEKLLQSPLAEKIFTIKRNDVLTRFYVYERN